METLDDDLARTAVNQNSTETYLPEPWPPMCFSDPYFSDPYFSESLRYSYSPQAPPGPQYLSGWTSPEFAPCCYACFRPLLGFGYASDSVPPMGNNHSVPPMGNIHEQADSVFEGYLAEDILELPRKGIREKSNVVLRNDHDQGVSSEATLNGVGILSNTTKATLTAQERAKLHPELLQQLGVLSDQDRFVFVQKHVRQRPWKEVQPEYIDTFHELVNVSQLGMRMTRLKKTHDFIRIFLDGSLSNSGPYIDMSRSML